MSSIRYSTSSLPKKSAGFKRGGLKSLAEGVAVLQRHAQQIARAANGSDRGSRAVRPSASACV